MLIFLWEPVNCSTQFSTTLDAVNKVNEPGLSRFSERVKYQVLLLHSEGEITREGRRIARYVAIRSNNLILARRSIEVNHPHNTQSNDEKEVTIGHS